MSEEEIASTTEAPPAPIPKFRVEILGTLYEIQQQHGLRNDDFERYRQYTTRRLGRIYEAVGLKHGKGKYVKKPVTPEVAVDSRYVLILLLTTERAWAQAEDRLTDISKHPEIAKRAAHHVRARLMKCIDCCSALRSVVEARCDDLTIREVIGYESEMKARAAFALENHKDAKELFLQAHAQYCGLKGQYSADTWTTILDRVQKIEELTRHCVSCLGEDASKLNFVSLSTLVGDGASNLQWSGHKIVITNRKMLRCAGDLIESVRKVKELEASVDKTALSTNTTAFNKTVDAYDRVFSLCGDLLAQVRLELRSETSGDMQSSHLLQQFVTYTLANARCDRSLLYIAAHEARYQHMQSGSNRKVKSTTSAGEIAHLYHTLGENALEVLHVPGVSDEMITTYEALGMAAKGGSVYYKGLAWDALGSTEKALACAGKAEGLLTRSLALHHTDLASALRMQARSYRCRLIASLIAQQHEDVTQLSDGVRKTQVSARSSSPLASSPALPVSAANTIKSDTTSTITCFSSTTRPEFEMVLPKPAFYDIASTFVVAPRLEGDDGSRGPAGSGYTATTQPQGNSTTTKPGGSWFGGWFKK